MLWHVFGIKADLNDISLQPAKYIPFERMSVEIKLKGETRAYYLR